MQDERGDPAGIFGVDPLLHVSIVVAHDLALRAGDDQRIVSSKLGKAPERYGDQVAELNNETAEAAFRHFQSRLDVDDQAKLVDGDVGAGAA